MAKLAFIEASRKAKESVKHIKCCPWHRVTAKLRITLHNATKDEVLAAYNEGKVTDEVFIMLTEQGAKILDTITVHLSAGGVLDSPQTHLDLIEEMVNCGAYQDVDEDNYDFAFVMKPPLEDIEQ